MTSLALKDIATDTSFVFEKYPFINIFGRRCIGKTQLAIHLVKKYFSKIPLLVVSNTCNLNNNYTDLTNTCIDSETFNNDFDDIIDSIKKNNTELSIIFDNAFFSEETLDNAKDLIKNRNHYKLNIIIITQFFKQLPQSIRNQIDYYLIRNENVDSELRSFHSHYKILKDIEKFRILLEESTKDFKFLIIDLTDLNKLNYIKANINDNKYQLDFNYNKKIKEKLNNIIDDAIDNIFIHKSIDINNPNDNYIKLKNKEQKEKYIKIIEDTLKKLKELN
jgi:hypothetical protein